MEAPHTHPAAPKPPAKRGPTPRMLVSLAIAAVLLVAVGVVSPQQLPVILLKLSLVTIGAVAGYWLDRELFPYARPDDWLPDSGYYPGIFAAACMMRRALIVVAAIVGVTLGL